MLCIALRSWRDATGFGVAGDARVNAVALRLTTTFAGGSVALRFSGRPVGAIFLIRVSVVSSGILVSGISALPEVKTSSSGVCNKTAAVRVCRASN